MRTLTEHTIIYDAECPMCNAYTTAFVKTGMLDGQGRVAYTEMTATCFPEVDWNRARNEIALINKKTRKVTYGVESLTTIVGHGVPWLKPLFDSQVFQLLIKRFYFFVSYNRKVIAPGRFFELRNACTPDFHLFYRIVYLVLAWLVTSAILTTYSTHLGPLVPASNYLREFAICAGQLVFQGFIVRIISRDRWIHYLGNMMTVSLAGALLLTPMILVATWVPQPGIFAAYFMLVVGLMLLEHSRRVRLLKLPLLITITWALYRLLVLSLILL